MCARARACVRTCVRACARASVRVCVASTIYFKNNKDKLQNIFKADMKALQGATRCFHKQQTNTLANACAQEALQTPALAQVCVVWKKPHET